MGMSVNGSGSRYWFLDVGSPSNAAILMYSHRPPSRSGDTSPRYLAKASPNGRVDPDSPDSMSASIWAAHRWASRFVWNDLERSIPFMRTRARHF